MFSILLLLLPPLTITLFTVFLQIQTTSSLSSSLQTPLILPLKTQTLPYGLVSLPTPSSTRKVSFYHNVTLTVSLTVGTPPQSVTMVLDTGSELSWLHCKKQQNINSVFNPHLSSSYTPIPCMSPICKTRTRDFLIPVSCDSNNLCHVTVSYADFTSLEGNLASDTFAISGSGQPGIIFGSMDSGFSSNANEDSKTTGLMGMNRGSLSFVTQMGFPKFSYCISGKDASGVLLFGDATFKWLGPLKYTPLVKMNTPLPYFDRVAYTVRLMGIRVGSKPLQVPKEIFAPDHTGAGQTMVDSGTRFTFLLGSVYTALRNEFVAQTRGVLTLLEDPNFVFEGAMDLCFRVRRGGVVPAVPAVTMVFEQNIMKQNKHNRKFSSFNHDLPQKPISNNEAQNLFEQYIQQSLKTDAIEDFWQNIEAYTHEPGFFSFGGPNSKLAISEPRFIRKLISVSVSEKRNEGDLVPTLMTKKML